MKVYSNEITSNEASAIMAALPDGRRNTYLGIAQKNSSSDLTIAAARLYIWNGYLASVVDRATGEVEVLLRNCIDAGFSEWNCAPQQKGSREWLLFPEGVLSEIVAPVGNKPLTQYAHLDTVQGVPVHDDYVAGLTFGNWVHLLPKPHAQGNNSRVILWNEALEPRVRGLNRVIFQKRAMFVKDMRNRATHRRPLVKDISAIEKVHQSCVELSRAMNPELGEWIRNERWIPEALEQSPLK